VSTEARLYFPHFAVNQGYTSTMGVLNHASTQATLTLKAYANDGSMIGTPAQRTVNANGQLFESVSSLFGIGSGGLLTGYVIVDSDQPGITGFCSFEYGNGSVESRAAVPAESIPNSKLIFSHIANGIPAGGGGNWLTGLALLNPFGSQVSYTLRVFDGAGTVVAVMSDVIGPHAKVSKILSYPVAGPGFFTQPLSLPGGHIEVTTDDSLLGILGFELFFTDSLTELAAVMAQHPNK
jgi:hypothetical protein